MPVVSRKVFIEENEDELLKMPRIAVTEMLTEKQCKFCELFVKNMNGKMACIKAGYKPTSAHIMSWKLRQNPEIARYIAWLKVRISKELHVDAIDIIDHYIRIAFADIYDFVEVKDNKVFLTDSEQLDGQIVKSVKQGRDGITVELYNKMEALEMLSRYFDIMPKDWKQKIEERKVDLMKERLDIERIKAGQVEATDDTDDGFISALRETADEVWDDNQGILGDKVPE